jgi:predicted phosphodiesterase
VIVRAESPVVRPAVLALLDDDGDTILLSDEGETRFHRFELSGLQPDTQYSYTVAAGNVTSEICVFSTAPVEPRSITVVAWGDSHYGPTVLEGIAERINEIRPDLLVTAGDMVGDGIHENEWADYVFQPLRHLRGGYAMHFPVGNHDHGSWRHHERGDNPYLNERWEPSGTEWGSTPYGYSFDYAGVHFVFVDPLHGCTGNEKFLGLNKGTAQYDWLERDLAASRGARWTILHVHEPPFCETWEGGYYDGQPELREHLVPLMEKYGVDICISGHAHTYERGLPHPPYNPATGEGNTVAYLVTGGGGSHLDNRKFREWPQIDIPPHRLEQTEDYLSNDHGEFYRYHFCTLRIEHERLECTAYWIRLDGTVVDTMDWFVLRKGIPRRS